MRILGKNYDDKALLTGALGVMVLSCLPWIGPLVSGIQSAIANIFAGAFTGVGSSGSSMSSGVPER